EAAGIREDGELVALKRARGEYIELDEAVGTHGSPDCKRQTVNGRRAELLKCGDLQVVISNLRSARLIANGTTCLRSAYQIQRESPWELCCKICATAPAPC